MTCSHSVDLVEPQRAKREGGSLGLPFQPLGIPDWQAESLAPGGVQKVAFSRSQFLHLFLERKSDAGGTWVVYVRKVGARPIESVLKSFFAQFPLISTSLSSHMLSLLLLNLGIESVEAVHMTL